MPWLLAEDEALKKALAGIVVSDRADANRRVPVYFGLPDIELREQSYPYITIDLVDIEEARERVHRGVVDLEYTPEGFPTPNPDTQALRTELPTPYDLTYQITSWARHPRHDRQILLQLLGDKIPHRFGQVVANEGSTEHNSTVRRLDLASVMKRDALDGDLKRLFRNVLTVRMSSELFPSTVPALLTRALSVEIVGATDTTTPDYQNFLSVNTSGN